MCLGAFEGLVLARKHGNEAGSSFTVRKVSGGIGVEKIFPLYSPNIDKIEIVKRSKVRQAKLYYIREKVAREIKRQMRRMILSDLSTESKADDSPKDEEAVEAEVDKAEATATADQAPNATATPEPDQSTDESKPSESDSKDETEAPDQNTEVATTETDSSKPDDETKVATESEKN